MTSSRKQTRNISRWDTLCTLKRILSLPGFFKLVFATTTLIQAMPLKSVHCPCPRSWRLRLCKSHKVRAMLLPGTRPLASSLPRLLLKNWQTDKAKGAGEGGRRPGPPPRRQPGAAAWGLRPSPVHTDTSSYTGNSTEKPTPDLWQFFPPRSGGGKERMIKDGGAQKQQLSTGESKE